MSQGWICPGCGQGYGPFVQACWHCRPRTITSTWTITSDPTLPCGGCGKTPCDHSTGCPMLDAGHSITVTA